MRLILLALALWPGVVAAESWERLVEDTAITATLVDRQLEYDAYTRQVFGGDGSTRYITERVSDGRWAARGGQYCSQWPPSEVWSCYDIDVAGDRVRFTSADGSVSEGAYIE